ncbi:MAG: ABC transporter ATP-binding protein [Lachnospirales bacterium]
MKDLTKFYKPFILLIIIIGCLSFLRAYGTLTLPSFTETIIDNGISRGGMEETVPKIIRGNTYIFISTASEDLANLYEPYNEATVNSSLYSEDLSNTYTLVEGYEENSELEDLYFMLYIYNVSIGNIVPSEDITAAISSAAGTGNEEFDISQVPSSIKSTIILEEMKYEYGLLGYDFDQARLLYVATAGGKMLLFALFVFVVVALTNYTASYVSTMVSRNIRQALFEKTLVLSNKELEKFSTSSLITRVTNDVTQVTNATNMVFQIAIYAPVLGIWGIYKSYITASNLVWINALSVFSIILVFSGVMYIAFPRFKKIQKLIDRLNLVTREMLTGNLVVRAFGKEKKVEERFDEASVEVLNTNTTIGFIMSSIFPIIVLIMNTTLLAVVFYGARDVESGLMNIGGVFAYMQYSTNILFAFMMLSMISFQIPRAFVSAKRIAEVLNEEPSIIDGKEVAKSNDGYIEFKNVTFMYGDAKDNEDTEKVLNNVSFVARPNEVTAIIGSTGSGKSTIVNLIPRFYDVTEGEILIDGLNIKEYELKALREKLAIVAQKAFLFSGTINSNIKYANDISDEEAEKIAEIAESINFINEKENKFEASITQGGKNVSGGQRQRLSIARALAKNSNILIFDDSFSALDYKTDFSLRQNIKTNLKNKTVLIVAQRISTIKDADNIIVLDEGNIVAEGKHDYLVENCDVYKEIVNSQLEKGGE